MLTSLLPSLFVAMVAGAGVLALGHLALRNSTATLALLLAVWVATGALRDAFDLSITVSGVHVSALDVVCAILATVGIARILSDGVQNVARGLALALFVLLAFHIARGVAAIRNADRSQRRSRMVVLHVGAAIRSHRARRLGPSRLEAACCNRRAVGGCRRPLLLDRGAGIRVDADLPQRGVGDVAAHHRGGCAAHPPSGDSRACASLAVSTDSDLRRDRSRSGCSSITAPHRVDGRSAGRGGRLLLVVSPEHPPE